jgi:hypothetical protein
MHHIDFKIRLSVLLQEQNVWYRAVVVNFRSGRPPVYGVDPSPGLVDISLNLCYLSCESFCMFFWFRSLLPD